MTPALQTILALFVVALAFVYLLRRARRNRQGKGGCGCAPDKFKRSLRR